MLQGLCNALPLAEWWMQTRRHVQWKTTSCFTLSEVMAMSLILCFFLLIQAGVSIFKGYVDTIPEL